MQNGQTPFSSPVVPTMLVCVRSALVRVCTELARRSFPPRQPQRAKTHVAKLQLRVKEPPE